MSDLRQKQVVPGLSSYYRVDLDETKREVKDDPGKVYGWHIENPHGTTKGYVQFFDADADNVTVGTTPPKFSLFVPAGGIDLSLPDGIEFSVGITVAATAGPANAVAPPADFITNIWYF